MKKTNIDELEVLEESVVNPILEEGFDLTEAGKSNALLYVAIGAGALVLTGVAYKKLLKPAAQWAKAKLADRKAKKVVNAEFDETEIVEEVTE